MTVCCVAKKESENGDSDDDDEYATASSGGEGDEKEEGADVSSHPSDTHGGPAHSVNLVTTRKGIVSCHDTHAQYRNALPLVVYVNVQGYMSEVNVYLCMTTLYHYLPGQAWHHCR